MRYEYRVRPLPTRGHDPVEVDVEALEVLLNEQGVEEFELVTVSFKDGLVFFQRDVYDDVVRRSPEHLQTVLTAVKSYGDVVSVQMRFAEGGVLYDDAAWLFLIDRILGES